MGLSLVMLVLCAIPLAHAQVESQTAAKFREASQAMRAGDLQTAGDEFTEVVKAAPSFAEAHFNLGLVREEQGRLDEAIASFEKALTLKPHLHGANLFLAVARYKLNQFDQALSTVRKETAAYPKDAPAWMWQGVIELAMDRPEEAAAALDKAASLAPDNVDILYHRGQAHLLVSKNSYQKMFEVDPKSWRVRQVLAQANADAERHLDAIAEYQEAIKLAPTQPGLHEELGSEFRNAGKPQEAEAAFEKELEIDPHNVLARYKLGVLAIERADGARAKQLIEEALRQKPGLRHADYNLGRAEMLLGQDENALKHMQQASSTETDPEVLQQAWFQLGIVYRRLHRMQEAQQAIANFQRLKNEEAEKSQEQLKKFKVQQDPEVAQPSEKGTNPQ
ncbi:MAG: tetratricopeptide repeat protein [Acidobacteria bacterium]|nr:tetratricopeptide repeat protein [Acidobacteriota bacterium]